MAPLILVLMLIVPLAGLLAVMGMHHFAALRIHIVLGVALITLALSGLLLLQGDQTLSYHLGGWRAPFGIELRADGLSRLMLLLTGLVMAAAALYQAGRELSRSEPPGKLTYHITFPLLHLALNGLFLTHDFFNFYVFFELAAVSSYLLVAMGRHLALEAAWKYAAQSVMGSVALLSAVAFIYGLTGSLNMTDAAQRMPGAIFWLAPFVLAAFMIKGSLFPFHFWQPDAYAAASTAGSAILAGALTNVGIYGLLRFFPLLFGRQLGWLLLWFGTASIVFGAVAAYRESDAKRMLGFSSTSQLGFVLVALGWGSEGAIAAAVLFTFHHGLTKALLFLGTGTLTDRFGTSLFTFLAGRSARAGGVKWVVGLGLFSLVGLPPAVGFLGKFSVFYAGIQAAAWPWVGAVAAGSILTLIYAARAYQDLFWAAPQAGSGSPGLLNVPRLGSSGIGLLAAAVLAAGLYGNPIWKMSVAAARAILAAQAAPVLEMAP